MRERGRATAGARLPAPDVQKKRRIDFRPSAVFHHCSRLGRRPQFVAGRLSVAHLVRKMPGMAGVVMPFVMMDLSMMLLVRVGKRMMVVAVMKSRTPFDLLNYGMQHQGHVQRLPVSRFQVRQFQMRPFQMSHG